MTINQFRSDLQTSNQSQRLPRSIVRPATLGIVVLLGVSYAFNSMDRLIFPTLLIPIKAEYGLNLAQGGFLSTSFALFIVVFGGFSGWSMAKFGRKSTMIGGLIAYSVFTLLTPLATGFIGIAVCRTLTGAGEAFQIGALWAIIGAYFGGNRGAAMGILNTLYGAGAFLGPMLGTRLADSFGSWRVAFYLYGAGGIVIALIMIAAVPVSFANAIDGETVTAQEDKKLTSFGLFNRNSILLALAFGFVGWSVFGFQSLYPTYLRSDLGYTVVRAGTAFAMYGIGAILAVVCGWLGDKLKRIGHLTALLLLVLNSYLIFHGTWSFATQALLSLTEGLLVSGYLYPRFVALVQRSVPPECVGYAMSLLIPTFYLGGFLSGFVFGALVDRFGWNIASTMSTALPAALALIITFFYDPRQVRGEA